ncbi:MAG: RagB/SusD family nutrient uptake outer membrane protein [Rikenellaceae bacterium]|jgi:hypothetical protein|nr:RagB/SusD family nutrient uptake outer membrane protein [Rikenellaceae bacterium]
MKREILTAGALLALSVTLASCDRFLEEHPKTFFIIDGYFDSEEHITTAVNGLYTFPANIFNGDIEIGSGTYIFLDYLPGYAIRPRAATTKDLQQAMSLTVAEDNTRLQALWQTAYYAINNANSVIEGIEASAPEVMDEDKKKVLLGEVYFFRAYYYFDLVRLFGEVPLKLRSTKDLSDAMMPLSSKEEVYARVETDLAKAEELMNGSPLSNPNGRITLGAVKAMQAKLFLTMAGYPLQKGVACYDKAWQKAKELYSSAAFSLEPTYEALRVAARTANAQNQGEYIWTVQRDKDNAGSGVHTNMLPYPAPDPVIAHASQSGYGGALAPAQLFYDSYAAGDRRADEQGYYYTEYPALNGSGTMQLGRPYIFKYWDQSSLVDAKSGANYPLMRYADVLLMMAEAKCMADGGTTTDADAIEAYWLVRKRAFPLEAKPASISSETVLKERFWELCFECQTWYDMLRTRKALRLPQGDVANLIGLYTPGHTSGAVFKESDLLFPYPVRERRLNPNLVRN